MEIGRLVQGYDHIVIDGPPRVTDLARSTIMAADVVLIRYNPAPRHLGSRRGGEAD